MLVRCSAIAMFMGAVGCHLFAHTVPTLVVEAEFTNARQSDIRVNIDPRLFLVAQPATQPPVAASWWMEQDEAARAKSVAAAIAYVEKTFVFKIGGTVLRGDWKVTAIDSTTMFPLGAESAEAHLLAQRQRPLPAVPGDFKVSVSNDCSVGVILLNSIEGKPERHPQSMFPGENSRGFKVPELPPTAAATTAAAVKTPEKPVRPVLLILLTALVVLLLLGLLWSRRRK